MAIKGFFEQTTKKWTATVKVDGEVQDITSDTITVYFYNSDKELKIEKQADMTLGDGQYEIILSKTDTAVSPGYYYYEIWWELSTGEQYNLERSSVKIEDSIVK